jgi:hypothetical protein
LKQISTRSFAGSEKLLCDVISAKYSLSLPLLCSLMAFEMEKPENKNISKIIKTRQSLLTAPNFQW